MTSAKWVIQNNVINKLRDTQKQKHVGFIYASFMLQYMGYVFPLVGEKKKQRIVPQPYRKRDCLRSRSVCLGYILLIRNIGHFDPEKRADTFYNSQFCLTNQHEIFKHTRTNKIAHVGTVFACLILQYMHFDVPLVGKNDAERTSPIS